MHEEFGGVMLGFTLEKIVSWMDAKGESNKKNHMLAPICGIAIDSRNVVPNSLFFALAGAKTDGHNFLAEAAKKGATCAVVKRGYAGDHFGMQLFFVDDTLIALQTAAKRWLEMSPAKRIAITGSLGKTSTKGFLYTLLQSKYKVSTTSGNKNSQVGLALAILNETMGDEDFHILEMGMTEKGHISKLVQMAPPHIALITSIAYVHAENFNEIIDIAKAKAEVFSHPKTEQVIVNADTRSANELLEMAHCKKESYSLDENAKAKWKMKIEAEKLIITEGQEKVVLPLVSIVAEHMYSNLLGAIACARCVGMSFDEIKAALGAITLPPRRLQVVEKNGITFINDAYNAAEDSMKGALDAVRKRHCKGRKIAVLGHMRELGKFSDECHRNVGRHALDCVDQVYSIGENAAPLVQVWQEAKKPVEWFSQFDELFSKLQKELRQGDLVLVKGSRALELERIIDKYA